MDVEKLIERLRQLELRITVGANETCGLAADALAAQAAEIKALRIALCEAAIPLEAMTMAGTTRDMSPELQDGVRHGIACIRQALAATEPKP